MKEQTFNLKGGVLIIGSLLWQNFVGGNDNTIRRDWRDTRLDLNFAIGVKAPMRYGRLSTGGIYTMTFSNSCRGRNLGTASVVPFRNNPVTNFTQLMLEAEKLATAEGMKRTFITSDGNGQPWCVLGILFNKTKISQADRKALTEWWQRQVSEDIDYSRFHSDDFKNGSEKTCILSGGLLNIPWIVPINLKNKKQLDDYDFLLATATQPNENKYPSIKKLVKAVKTDKDRKYFLRNYENGLTTFQDIRIKKKLPV